MGERTSVSLDDHQTVFVGELVRAGRYGSADDAVRAGLRLLEEHESKVEALRQALMAGEDSGPARPLDFEAFKARKRAESAPR